MKLIKVMLGIFLLMLLTGCALKDRVIVSQEEEAEVSASDMEWILEGKERYDAMVRALPLFDKVWSMGEEIPIYSIYEDENNTDETYVGEGFQRGYFKVTKAIYYDHLSESDFTEDFETYLHINEDGTPIDEKSVEGYVDNSSSMKDVKDPAYVVLDIEIETFDLEEKGKRDPGIYRFSYGDLQISYLNDQGEKLGYYYLPSYVYHETDPGVKNKFLLMLESNKKIETRIGFVIDKNKTPIENLYLGYEVSTETAYVKLNWSKGEAQ